MAGWRDRNGSTRAWRKLRDQVLARDGWVCQVRGPNCTGRATTADHHPVPLAMGGTDTLDNLRAACGPCNYGAGGALATSAGRLGRPSRRWV